MLKYFEDRLAAVLTDAGISVYRGREPDTSRNLGPRALVRLSAVSRNGSLGKGNIGQGEWEFDITLSAPKRTDFYVLVDDALRALDDDNRVRDFIVGPEGVAEAGLYTVPVTATLNP